MKLLKAEVDVVQLIVILDYGLSNALCLPTSPEMEVLKAEVVRGEEAEYMLYQTA